MSDELNELKTWLERARSQSPTTEAAVESAMSIHLMAAGHITALQEVQAEAKTLLAEIMSETGKVELRTRVGKAYVSAPAQIVTYDSKALDRASLLDANLAAALAPYRKVSERAGSLTIRGGG
jgi:ABC-type enterochelin transport system substrate-binding protein